MSATVDATPAPTTTLKDAGESLAELATLHDKLDGLWETYLSLLEEYQEAQKEVQKQMASGFFSLTQANFKSATRGRYGRDYYDERMKASRRCRNSFDDGDPNGTRVQLVMTSDDRQSSTAKRPDGEEEKRAKPQQQPSPPSTPKGESDAPSTVGADISAADEHEKPAQSPQGSSGPQRDPLRWFGILVPRELRSAQTTFASAVDGPVVQTVNAGRALREVEAEIRRLRKAVRRAEKAVGS
ncbi:hypothetical protein LTR85_011529 [Meristemomyces frigidus]|nr:hypothetical protein LTR85_011529 [Meristemomyces frigidus]